MMRVWLLLWLLGATCWLVVARQIGNTATGSVDENPAFVVQPGVAGPVQIDAAAAHATELGLWGWYQYLEHDYSIAGLMGYVISNCRVDSDCPAVNGQAQYCRTRSYTGGWLKNNWITWYHTGDTKDPVPDNTVLPDWNYKMCVDLAGAQLVQSCGYTWIETQDIGVAGAKITEVAVSWSQTVNGQQYTMHDCQMVNMPTSLHSDNKVVVTDFSENIVYKVLPNGVMDPMHNTTTTSECVSDAQCNKNGGNVFSCQPNRWYQTYPQYYQYLAQPESFSGNRPQYMYGPMGNQGRLSCSNPKGIQGDCVDANGKTQVQLYNTLTYGEGFSYRGACQCTSFFGFADTCSEVSPAIPGTTCQRSLDPRTPDFCAANPNYNPDASGNPYPNNPQCGSNGVATRSDAYSLDFTCACDARSPDVLPGSPAWSQLIYDESGHERCMDYCSVTLCSGNGWCEFDPTGKTGKMIYYPNIGPNAYNRLTPCLCLPGWKGSDCSILDPDFLCCSGNGVYSQPGDPSIPLLQRLNYQYPLKPSKVFAPVDVNSGQNRITVLTPTEQALCLDPTGAAVCACAPGTYGGACEYTQAECDAIVCSNRGKCGITHGSLIECVCDDGYMTFPPFDSLTTNSYQNQYSWQNTSSDSLAAQQAQRATAAKSVIPSFMLIGVNQQCQYPTQASGYGDGCLVSGQRPCGLPTLGEPTLASDNIMGTGKGNMYFYQRIDGTPSYLPANSSDYNMLGKCNCPQDQANLGVATFQKVNFNSPNYNNYCVEICPYQTAVDNSDPSQVWTYNGIKNTAALPCNAPYRGQCVPLNNGQGGSLCACYNGYGPISFGTDCSSPLCPMNRYDEVCSGPERGLCDHTTGRCICGVSPTGVPYIGDACELDATDCGSGQYNYWGSDGAIQQGFVAGRSNGTAAVLTGMVASTGQHDVSQAVIPRGTQ